MTVNDILDYADLMIQLAAKDSPLQSHERVAIVTAAINTCGAPSNG